MEKLKNKVVATLRWSEKYTKTDMLYLFKGGFWGIFSQIVVSVSTFLLAISFAHFISKEAYGEYKYILSLASILGAFTLTGLGTAVARSVTQEYEGTLNDTFWKNIRWSVLFMLIALSTSVYYFVNGNNSIGTAMLVVGSFSPFFNSTNLYNAYLIAKKDFKRSAIYFGIVGNLFPSLCIFVAILLTNKPLWLITTYFVSNTLIGIILYTRVIKIYKPNNKVDPEALGYSKHLSIMNILLVVANNVDQVLVFHYIGAAGVAVYNFAIAIPDQIKGPMKSLSSLIFPKFTEREDAEIRSGMKNKIVLLFCASVIMIGIYIILAPYIFHIFFPKYLDSIFYSQILSLSLLGMASIPAETYLSAKKKIKEQYAVNVLVSITQIIITFLFIFYLGLIGTVAAKVITRLLFSLMNVALYEKASKQTI